MQNSQHPTREQCAPMWSIQPKSMLLHCQWTMGKVRSGISLRLPMIMHWNCSAHSNNHHTGRWKSRGQIWSNLPEVLLCQVQSPLQRLCCISKWHGGFCAQTSLQRKNDCSPVPMALTSLSATCTKMRVGWLRLEVQLAAVQMTCSSGHALKWQACYDFQFLQIVFWN